jgi:hypothetical protein
LPPSEVQEWHSKRDGGITAETWYTALAQRLRRSGYAHRITPLTPNLDRSTYTAT